MKPFGDLTLHQIAELITNDQAINFMGAEFEHLPTGKMFSITIADVSAEQERKQRLEELEKNVQVLTESLGYFIDGNDATDLIHATGASVQECQDMIDLWREMSKQP
ncbi:coil containing protein [Vibrio phage 1.261.O._10N.286.51.A7]|uniref:Coil containing protein n=1 Tax=Vibrio phage 1.261.O._10N.286.51.A7 TaxID=1881237 RepID=A0A2I7RZD4_9CAUD|nr:coil containing protein [Vibrio phage 1.261.O._10N.286.51.A7]AUR99015.1 coil containing protein [Vibrio phage 1.261.O._10N.286.51.A7]